MKRAAKTIVPLILLGISVADAQIPYPNPIKHVVIVFQENRTPDNLFQGLLTWPGLNPANYVIASSGTNHLGQTLPLVASPLGSGSPTRARAAPLRTTSSTRRQRRALSCVQRSAV